MRTEYFFFETEETDWDTLITKCIVNTPQIVVYNTKVILILDKTAINLYV